MLVVVPLGLPFEAAIALKGGPNTVGAAGIAKVGDDEMLAAADHAVRVGDEPIAREPR